MNTNFSIDWLNFTDDLTVLLTPGAYAYAARKVGWTAEAAHNGYRVAYRNENGALVQWNEDRPDMRVMTQYSGTVLTRYADTDEVDAMRIAQFHAQKGARLTRIDLAFDVHDQYVNIAKLYKDLCKGKAASSSTKFNLITGNDGGTTLYVGSRQSDKFLRIYDKAAERDVPGFWTRVELEIKGDTANEIGKRLALSTGFQLIATAKRMLLNMVAFDDDWYRHITADNVLIDWTISHKSSDNLKQWLAKQVAPAIANYLLRGGERDIMAQLDILIEAEMRRKSRL